MSVDNQQNLETQNIKQEDEVFNLQDILMHALQYWWLFALFIIVSLLSAFLYLRYSTAQYKIQAKILVKDSKKGVNAPGMQMFDELNLLGGQSSVDNEVELLKSRTVMENTVAALQLNVRYFAEGKVKKTEIFAPRLPFLLALYDLKEDSIKSETKFIFEELNNKQFKLTFNKNQKTLNYGDSLQYSFGKLIFSKIRSTNIHDEKQLTIFINRSDNTVANFQQKLTVAVTSKTVSTIDLDLEDEVPERGELLVNTLLRLYNQMNTEDKNRVADSTITFIDNRLVYVTRELGDVEKGIEEFRQRNQLTNLSAQGQLLLENSSDYFKELSKTEVQISIVQSLEKYLKDEQNTSRTIPAGLVIEDPTFASLIEKYNTLQLEQDRQLQTTTESNPVVQRLRVQIANLKGDIIANLATIKRSMEITRTQLKNRTNSFESQIKQVPRKERTFLEISRQQSIKQELYLYLLKKREETAVSKAANIDNARIVDSAKAQRLPFSPNRRVIYLSAIMIGLIVPAAFLFFKNILNNKVLAKKDVTSVTAAPIIGEIGRSPFSGNLVVKEHPRHAVAEQIRLLRTNLDFMHPASATSGRVIMVTSSMSGEGKSFLALNLAAMMSLGGKKVVLLEFDLRKPKISQYLGFENNEGLSSFLIKKNIIVNNLVKEVQGMENLFLLGSGPIPPNPAELINSGQTALLFDGLKQKYDHIVVDVPPVGVVSDALLLAVYTDISIYVVRQNYTYKNQLEMVNELYKQKKLPNLGIVVNDIKKQKGYGYGYGYGYSYGYGYGYSEKD